MKEIIKKQITQSVTLELTEQDILILLGSMGSTNHDDRRKSLGKYGLLYKEDNNYSHDLYTSLLALAREF